MKQAILITAYKNYHHLREIINFFDTNFELYIHIDKKSKISKMELDNLRKHDIVKLVSQKYNVNWGGFNHLKSILYLTEQGLRNPENKYFHLISGHDFPIKNRSYFIEFFKNNNVEYMNYCTIPKIGCADNENMDRIEYYNFYDIWNAKTPRENVIIKRFVEIQKRIGFKRLISSRMPKLYGGSTWWSLSRDCVSYVITYTKKNKYVLNRLKYTLCSEEFYFQTVIMNSNFAGKVDNNDLRYIDWAARNGNNPAILDDTDYEKLVQTEALFARRFEYPYSIGLINKIKLVLK
ncbi:beta-1,6-N-acetylglucosaminyltransferase [Flavobacterium sp. ZS1P14]|uniref:beta-1,6-N-acetylglucosaminyltransferase n=1 Tax=Flavobacterium sp. ZS1P14 TaxID=3401729 RepID=UPI003AB0BFB3